MAVFFPHIRTNISKMQSFSSGNKLPHPSGVVRKTTSSLKTKSLILCIHHSGLFPSGDGSLWGFDRELTEDMTSVIVVYVV